MNSVLSLAPNDQRKRIADALRAVAAEIDSGEIDPNTILLIVDSRGIADLSVRTLGYRPRLSEAIGLLEFAKMSVYEDGQSDG